LRIPRSLGSSTNSTRDPKEITVSLPSVVFFSSNGAGIPGKVSGAASATSAAYQY
jgi:hypothetical protein